MHDRVLLDYGSGGRASHRLVNELFLRHFADPELARLNDAAALTLPAKVAVSTDGFTVDPIFFPGGNIGSLAVHGTVNDVAMLGARPLYLTCAYIIEEGLPLADLERVVEAMGRAAREAGVRIVAGDTKVVPKGQADKIFITTTGIGERLVEPAPAGDLAREGDVVLVTGTLGDHGLTVLSSRQGLAFETPVRSDSACLAPLVLELLNKVADIHVLRDPTRGGLATTLNEIAGQSNVGIVLQEKDVPVRPEVRSGCSFLGLDPLYLANEGKFLCILPEARAEQALAIMKASPLGVDAARIGAVTSQNPGKVVITTPLGGHRLLTMLEGEQLPRIC